MEKLKLKTDIKCLGCVAKFTPHIEHVAGVKAWDVDVTTPDKVLTVESDLSREELVALVREAGFQVREVVSEGHSGKTDSTD